MVSTISTSERKWEYRDFIYHQWDSHDLWIGLSYDDTDTATVAQSIFWETHRDNITCAIQGWQEQGWDVLLEPGPAAISLEKSVRLDRHIDPADILLWFMTLGLALVIQLLLDTPRRYVTYKPCEFRLRMHRLKTSDRALESQSNAVQRQGLKCERIPSLAEKSYRRDIQQ